MVVDQTTPILPRWRPTGKRAESISLAHLFSVRPSRFSRIPQRPIAQFSRAGAADGTRSIILAGAGLIREREHGTIEHLLVMPLTPFQIMAAKVWANGLVVLLAAALSLRFVVQGALAMPIAGSVPLFLFAAVLHLFSTTAMGILLATMARSMPQFALLMILVVVPLNMLSGGTSPPDSMPLAVQAIMLAAPTTHFVSLAQAILFRGAGLAVVVWPQLLAIVAIGAAVKIFPRMQ